MPPSRRVLSRYPTPALPMMNAREPGSSRGRVDKVEVGVGRREEPFWRSVGVRRMTALPKSKLDVELPLPVAT
jgi:hypothetical protein